MILICTTGTKMNNRNIKPSPFKSLNITPIVFLDSIESNSECIREVFALYQKIYD